MSVIIMFGHGMNGDVADSFKVINLGRQVTYSELGIVRGRSEVDYPYLNFTPIQCTPDNAIIVCHGDLPTQDQISEAVRMARISHTWKFT